MTTPHAPVRCCLVGQRAEGSRPTGKWRKEGITLKKRISRFKRLWSEDKEKAFWVTFNALGVATVSILWIVAAIVGWLRSITYLSHISMATFVVAFISAFRSDR